MVGASNHKVMVVSQCGLVDGHVLVVVLSSKEWNRPVQCNSDSVHISQDSQQKPPQQCHFFPQRSTTIHNPIRDARTNHPKQSMDRVARFASSWVVQLGENLLGDPPWRSEKRGQHVEKRGRPGTPRHRRCRCPLWTRRFDPAPGAAQWPSGPVFSNEFHPLPLGEAQKMMSQMAHGMLGGYVTAYVIYVLDPDDPAIFGNDCRTSSIWSSNDSASSWRSFR